MPGRDACSSWSRSTKPALVSRLLSNAGTAILVGAFALGCVVPNYTADVAPKGFVAVPGTGVANSQAAGASYAVGQAFVYQFNGWGVAAEIGDVTGDGRADVVVATSTYGTEHTLSVLIFEQKMDGNLEQPIIAPYIPAGVSYPGGFPWGTGLVVTDLDNDGVDDIAVGHKKGVTVFRGESTFEPTLLTSTISPAPKAMSLFPADVNLDGNMDLVSSCVYGGGCAAGPATIWYGDGDLGLSSMENVEVVNMFPTIDVGDLTGDGIPDLLGASVDGLQRYFHLHAHNGVDGFEPKPLTIEIGNASHFRSIGDFTGDGLNDIATVTGSQSSILTFVEQTSPGVLGVPYDASLLAGPPFGNAIDIKDVDDDGRADVVMAHGGAYATVSVLIGGQTPAIQGTIGGSSQYSDGALAVGDFSSDGCGDIALADMNYGFFFAHGVCPPDLDDDGLRNHLDNCDDVANVDQVDSDGDGFGDACDTCTDIPDPQQGNFDGDAYGDLCDEDMDNDGIPNHDELASGMNPLHIDSDADSILDSEEFGPTNPTDTDEDGDIDAVDLDSDGDGVTDLEEAGDADPGTPAVDTDSDGLPDYRDLDSDNDGIPDRVDSCRADPSSPCPMEPDAGVLLLDASLGTNEDAGIGSRPTGGCYLADNQAGNTLPIVALGLLLLWRRRRRAH